MDSNNNVISLIEYSSNKQELPSEKGELFPPNPSTNLLRRVGAMLIDLTSIGVLNAIIQGAYSLFVTQMLAPIPSSMKVMLTQGGWPLQIGIYLLIYSSYFFYSSYVLSGQSLGKTVMGLMVINDNNLNLNDMTPQQISMQQAAYRTLGYVLCYFSFGTFFIFNFASEDKRGLADFLSLSRTVDKDWYENFIYQKEVHNEVIRINISTLDRAA